MPVQDVRGETEVHPQIVEKYGQALLPMIELDNATRICEATAICHFFEELPQMTAAQS